MQSLFNQEMPVIFSPYVSDMMGVIVLKFCVCVSSMTGSSTEMHISY